VSALGRQLVVLPTLTFEETWPSAGEPAGLPSCFSTKAWYASFLLSKNLIIGPALSRRAWLRLTEIARSGLLVRMIESLGSDSAVSRLALD
jgi:hypothetical protein